MFYSGQQIADYLEKVEDQNIPDPHIQTHGVELGIEKVFRLNGPSYITNDTYQMPERGERQSTVADIESAEDNESMNYIQEEVVTSNHYQLNRGNYVVRYDKTIHVPDKVVGFVFPRSRLMRSGVQLDTAVWESGYTGKGEGGLYVHNQAFIKEDTRIGQIVMACSEVFEQYDGTHQGENI